MRPSLPSPYRIRHLTGPGRPGSAVAAAGAGLAVLLSGAGLARAQAAPDRAYAPLEQMARDWVQPALAAVMGPDGGGPLRPEILVGTLDNRL